MVLVFGLFMITSLSTAIEATLNRDNYSNLISNQFLIHHVSSLVLLQRHLRSVSIRTKAGNPNLEFNQDGTLKFVQLNIMNLNNLNMWEKVGFRRLIEL